MVESFENLDNNLRGWAKDKVQKKSGGCKIVWRENKLL